MSEKTIGANSKVVSTKANERMDEIRNVLRRQREASRELDKSLYVLSFLSHTMKTASLDDNAQLNYPEIAGIAVILELLKNSLADNVCDKMPFVMQLEELFDVKLEAYE